MPQELLDKIASELKSMKYRGFIGFHARNEPLLDKRIYSIATQYKAACPDAALYMSTNGDLLDIEKLKNLFNAGFNQVAIQAYDKERIPFIESLLEEAESSIPGITIGRKSPDLLNASKVLYYSDKTVWKEGIGNFTNRGGTLKFHNKSIPHDRNCVIQQQQLLVYPDGTVPLCCNDWFGKYSPGNANEKTLEDLWNSKLFKKYRAAHRRGRYDMAPCNACDC